MDGGFLCTVLLKLQGELVELVPWSQTCSLDCKLQQIWPQSLLQPKHKSVCLRFPVPFGSWVGPEAPSLDINLRREPDGLFPVLHFIMVGPLLGSTLNCLSCQVSGISISYAEVGGTWVTCSFLLQRIFSHYSTKTRNYAHSSAVINGCEDTFGCSVYVDVQRVQSTSTFICLWPYYRGVGGKERSVGVRKYSCCVLSSSDICTVQSWSRL